MQNSKDTPNETKRTLISFSVVLACTILALIFAPDVNTKVNFPDEFKARINFSTQTANITKTEATIDELLDDSPMFITTTWNYARRHIPEKVTIDLNTIPVERFKIVGQEMLTKHFEESELKEVEKAKTSFLNSILRNVFTSMGREESQTQIAESGIFKLVDLRSGKIVKKQTISNELSTSMTAIAEFSVSISDDGWVSKPLPRISSGNEKTDAELSKMLDTTMLLKDVKSGDYKAIFAP